VQEADFRRNAAGEVVIDEHNLVERLSHVANGRRNAAAKPVVCKNDHRGRGVTEAGGNGLTQPIGVEKDGIQRAVEEFARDGPLKVIEPEIKVTQRRQRKHNSGEGTHKAVVAEIELMEEAEMDKGIGHSTTKAVGVEMQEGQVGETSRQVGREVAG
jgi:hypothetical protein